MLRATYLPTNKFYEEKIMHFLLLDIDFDFQLI